MAEPAGTPARPYGLSKDERLRRRADFQQTFENGSRAHGRYLTVFARPTSQGAARLGVVASRKVGSAVSRNYAKRLIRDLFRTHKPATAADIVVVVRRELLDASFASLEADYRSALRRARRS